MLECHIRNIYRSKHPKDNQFQNLELTCETSMYAAYPGRTFHVQQKSLYQPQKQGRQLCFGDVAKKWQHL